MVPSVVAPQRAQANSSEPQRTPANLSELQRAPANSSEPQRTAANPGEIQRTQANPSETQRTPANLSEPQQTPTNSSELQRTPASPSELQRSPVNPSEPKREEGPLTDRKSKRSWWSHVSSAAQGPLHSILAQGPPTASGAQFCLLCCQPEPVPRSSTARVPQFTPWDPCRPLAWAG